MKLAIQSGATVENAIRIAEDFERWAQSEKTYPLADIIRSARGGKIMLSRKAWGREIEINGILSVDELIAVCEMSCPLTPEDVAADDWFIPALEIETCPVDFEKPPEEQPINAPEAPENPLHPAAVEPIDWDGKGEQLLMDWPSHKYFNYEGEHTDYEFFGNEICTKDWGWYAKSGMIKNGWAKSCDERRNAAVSEKIPAGHPEHYTPDDDFDLEGHYTPEAFDRELSGAKSNYSIPDEIPATEPDPGSEKLWEIPKLFTWMDMETCFNESRLTHPVAGFKHGNFDDFMESQAKIPAEQPTPKTTDMDFLEAMKACVSGKRVGRKAWKGQQGMSCTPGEEGNPDFEAYLATDWQIIEK